MRATLSRNLVVAGRTWGQIWAGFGCRKKCVVCFKMKKTQPCRGGERQELRGTEATQWGGSDLLDEAPEEVGGTAAGTGQGEFA